MDPCHRCYRCAGKLCSRCTIWRSSRYRKRAAELLQGHSYSDQGNPDSNSDQHAYAHVYPSTDPDADAGSDANP